MDWQPIETAPKELRFSEYILGTDGKATFAMEWMEDEGCWANVWDNCDRGFHEVTPTHWAPLPNPPA